MKHPLVISLKHSFDIHLHFLHRIQFQTLFKLISLHRSKLNVQYAHEVNV